MKEYKCDLCDKIFPREKLKQYRDDTGAFDDPFFYLCDKCRIEVLISRWRK